MREVDGLSALIDGFLENAPREFAHYRGGDDKKTKRGGLKRRTGKDARSFINRRIGPADGGAGVQKKVKRKGSGSEGVERQGEGRSK